MTAVLLAGLAAMGVALVLSERWGLPRTSPAAAGVLHSLGPRLRAWLDRSGLPGVSPAQFAVASAAAGVAAAGITTAVLGPGLPAVAVGAAASMAPTALWRRRHAAAALTAREAWPGIIEEVRIRVGSIGRPIPQALLEAGLGGPPAVRPAFLAAQREWALTTDFARTVAVLKDGLRDPTADAVCETLLIVHEVGGDPDARLAALAEDRRTSLRDQAEATARQAGARVARWFVVIVPAGMAFAGLNLGDGGDAYRTTGGQLATAASVALIALCWWWAGRIMRLPTERRVFDR